MFTPHLEKNGMTAVAARAHLRRLEAERLESRDAGLGANATYMAALASDIRASRDAYVGIAVTEIATLRAELSGALEG